MPRWRSAAPQDFVLDVLVGGLGISGVVVGHDFEFGKGRAGNLATLSYMGEMEGFGVTAFDTVIGHGHGKDLLHPDPPDVEAGQAGRSGAAAGPFLGGRGAGGTWRRARPHHGLSHRQHASGPLPGAGLGVYAVRVAILEDDRAVARHDGVANFGIRPMYQVNVPLLETHLFDFDGDLYGKYLSVELIRYIRPEAQIPQPGRPDRPDRRRCRQGAGNSGETPETRLAGRVPSGPC